MRVSEPGLVLASEPGSAPASVLGLAPALALEWVLGSVQALGLALGLA